MGFHSALGTRHPARARAFTLVELLVVIAIIAVLIGILIPVVGKVRTAGYETNTKALINQIAQACESYKADYQSYPGPLPNSFLDGATQPQLAWKKKDGTTATLGGGTAAAGGTITGARVTGTENLVLGLCGGLVRMPTGAVPFGFDPNELGKGPRNFNPIRPSQGKPYMEVRNLSEYGDTYTNFEDDRSSPTPVPTKDTPIPEFVDSWPNGMPLLYIRANPGTNFPSGTPPTAKDNNIVTNDPAGRAQYSLFEVLPYTQSSIGVGRTIIGNDPHGLKTVDVSTTLAKQPTPYDAYAYLSDPTSGTATNRQARRRDGFVLISAGRDRVYGTADDLTNFGTILP